MHIVKQISSQPYKILYSLLKKTNFKIQNSLISNLWISCFRFLKSHRSNVVK